METAGVVTRGRQAISDYLIQGDRRPRNNEGSLAMRN